MEISGKSSHLGGCHLQVVKEVVYPSILKCGLTGNSAKPQWKRKFKKVFESERRSVTSDSLQLHGLHRPWNSPGQNTGVGSLSLLQGVLQPRDRTQVSLNAGRFFTS